MYNIHIYISDLYSSIIVLLTLHMHPAFFFCCSIKELLKQLDEGGVGRFLDGRFLGFHY